MGSITSNFNRLPASRNKATPQIAALAERFRPCHGDSPGKGAGWVWPTADYQPCTRQSCRYLVRARRTRRTSCSEVNPPATALRTARNGARVGSYELVLPTPLQPRDWNRVWGAIQGWPIHAIAVVRAGTCRRLTNLLRFRRFTMIEALFRGRVLQPNSETDGPVARGLPPTNVENYHTSL